MIDYEAYQAAIIQGHTAARQAPDIDTALQIQAAAYTNALRVAMGQALVTTTGSPSAHTGGIE